MITFDDSIDIPKVRLDLAKPNRKVVGILKNIHGLTQSLRLRELNSMSFTVPYNIEKYGEVIKNPIIEKLQSQYLVRRNFKNTIEWYILSSMKSSDSNKVKNAEITVTSLGYQLSNKKIREWAGVFIDGEYRKESLSPYQVLNSLLETSTWAVNYIDPEFQVLSRYFDFSNTSLLEAIYNVADVFGGIIKWDTEKKTFDLIKEENAGTNKGFRVTVNKYLKSIEKDVRLSEIVTRLKVYGNEGLSIQSVNPLGTDYLEDFSFFMRGFEMDEVTGQVLSPSTHMSDDLCIALINYNKIVAVNRSQFNNYLAQKNSLLESQIPIRNKITELNVELGKTEDLIEVAQKNNQPTTDLFIEKNRLNNEIQNNRDIIESINDGIRVIDLQIDNLREQMKMSNNLTPELLIELDDYIIEDVWEDSNYTDPQTMMDDAQKVFDDNNKPKQEITMDIINFFETIDGQRDWDRLDLGDKFTTCHEDFDIDITTQLTGFDINHDDASINITFSNTKSNVSDEDKFVQQIKNSISTTSTVNSQKYSWNNINSVENTLFNYMNNTLESAKQEIVGGLNENVTINQRGITSYDTDDPLKFIRIMHSVIGLTKNGGETFDTAITPYGIVADYLMGKVIIGGNLYLENEAGKFRFDQDGVTIEGNALNITGGLPPSQLDPDYANSIVHSNTSYTNGIRIDTADGVVVTRNDGNVKGYLNATDGLKYQAKVGGTMKDVLYFDLTDNSLIIDGIIYARDLKIGGKSVLTDGDKISTMYIENLVVGDNVTMGSNAKISWSQVTQQPTIPSTPQEVGAIPATYINSQGIWTKGVYAQEIVGTRISGVEFYSTNGMGDTVLISDGQITSTNTLNSRQSYMRSGMIGTLNPNGGVGYQEFYIMPDSEGIMRLSCENASGSYSTLKMSANFQFSGQVDFSGAYINWGSNAPKAVFG